MSALKRYELEMKKIWREYMKCSEKGSSTSQAKRLYKKYLQKLHALPKAKRMGEAYGYWPRNDRLIV